MWRSERGSLFLRPEKKLSGLRTYMNQTIVDQSLDLCYADAYWPKDLDSDIVTTTSSMWSYFGISCIYYTKI